MLATGCGSGGGGGAGIVDIQVEPQSVQLAKGTTTPLKATALYSNGAKEDVTAIAEWTSAEPSTVAIGTETQAGQLVLGAEVGTTQVTASYSGFEAAATITVTQAVPTGLEISPDAVSQPKGTSRSLAAIATFSDGTSQDVTADASWTTSNAAIVAVSDSVGSKGRITAVEFGNATVTATFQGFAATSAVTVSSATLSRVEVEPTSQSIANGTQFQFAATALFSDGTTQDVTAAAAWSSSNAAIATVGNAAGTKGLAQGEGEGSAQISATYLNQTGSGTLTVTAALLTGVEISPIDATIANGTARQFTATAVFSDGSKQNVTAAATWASSNAAVATISNAAGSSGLAQSVDVGTTGISFTYNSFSATTNLTVSAAVIKSIEVTPANSSIAKGTQQQFAATAVFTDDTTQDITGEAAWTSTNTTTATVNDTASKGLATAVNQGSTSIRAAYQGVTGATGLTVTAAIVTGLKVTPASPSIANGTSQQFTATALFSDGSEQVVTTAAQWSSSAPSVATISNASGSQGRATAVSVGKTDIGATYQDQSDATELTVTSAVLDRIEVSPVAQTIPAGQTQQYTATGVFTDGTTQDLTATVTWSSTDATVIDISNASPNNGLAVARATGTATIKALDSGSAKEGSTSVTVSAATLQSIQVTPSNGKLAAGFQRYFQAIGVFSDGTSRDITEDVVWSSADTAKATINTSTAGSKGLAKGVAAGAVKITAAKDGLTRSVDLTVDTSTLTSVAIDNTSPTRLAVKASGQYTASASFSGGYGYDVTRQVVWAEDSNGAIAAISNAVGSKGLATAKDKEGSVNFTAKYNEPDAASGTTSAAYPVNVTALQYQSITVSPASVTVAKGLQVQFTATAVFEDGSNAGDVTGQLDWSVLPGGTDNVEISNAKGSKGLAFAKETDFNSSGSPVNGTATIRASGGNGTFKDATMTVTSAQLQSVTIEAVDGTLTSPTSIPLEFGVAYKARAFYTDGSVTEVTNQATWQSLAPTTVSVGNTSPGKGYAKGEAVGTTTITATFGGLTASLTVTVVSTAVTSIAITSADQQVSYIDNEEQFTARGTFANGSQYDVTRDVSWSSSVPNVAAISNNEGSEGLATAGIQPGSTNITASAGGVTSPARSLTNTGLQ